MPPAPKKRKTAKENCHGEGCGQPACASCWLDLDEMSGDLAGLPGRGQFVRPDRRGGGRNKTQPLNGQAKSGLSSPENDTAAFKIETSAAAAARAAVAVPVDLKLMVAQLDAEVLRALVVDMAPNNPQLLRSIKDAHRARKTTRPAAAPAATPKPRGRAAKPAPQPAATPGRVAIPLSKMVPVTKFDDLSKVVWHALNNKELLRMSERRQSEKAEEVLEEVRECIDRILTKAKPDSPLQTKRSAVETLRKIMKTIILADGVAGDEMRNAQRRDQRVEQCLRDMLSSMTPAERIATGSREEKGETLLEKMKWIKEHQEMARNTRERMYYLGDVVTMLESGCSVVVLD